MKAIHVFKKTVIQSARHSCTHYGVAIYSIIISQQYTRIEIRSNINIIIKNITNLILSPPGSFLIQLNSPIMPFLGSFSATRMIFCFTEPSSVFKSFCNTGIHKKSVFDILITLGKTFCSKGLNVFLQYLFHYYILNYILIFIITHLSQ